MKAILAIVLGVSLLFSAFGKSVLVLHYQLNKKTITETRCVNRDKPEMQCNGHCYLAKQLKKAAEKESPVPDFRNLKELSPFVTSEVAFQAPRTPVFISPNYSPGTAAPVMEACPGSVFQPPEA